MIKQNEQEPTTSSENIDHNNETDNTELICSVRQERSSQALLITFDTPQLPISKLFILIFSL
jgi:hypothetical protein